MKSKKRLLVVSYYPIKQPMHGGQKRVDAVVKEYEKVFSKVKFVAIFIREHHPQYDHDDIYITGKWAKNIIHDHLTSDIKTSQAIQEDPRLKHKIKRLLLTFKPDIIQFEQVFPFMGLRPILEELNLRPKIIYNSQNNEVVIKKDVMTIANAPNAEINNALNIIKTNEMYLAQHADLLATVSKEDGEYYMSLGAKNYILAPNGTSKLTPSAKSMQYWKSYLEDRHVKHVILFVGSSHLPNMQGLQQMVGLRLGFLSPNTRLFVAGGTGKYLKEHFNYSNMLDSMYWQRAISLGHLTEDMLSGLLCIADVIILPIVKGGGSNLKTAEAIINNKKLVATTFAFRGYERYLKLPNIWMADTPKEFRKAIVEALRAPFKERTAAETELAEQVQWKYTLKELVQEATKL